MDKELEALEHNGTWVLTSLPLGKKAFTCKRIYKVKFKPDGSIEMYKNKLVIRGFKQIQDKEYKHSFSPMEKLTAISIFIALATAKEWPLHQLNINNVFLKGFIDEEVYMQRPERYLKARLGQIYNLCLLIG